MNTKKTRSGPGEKAAERKKNGTKGGKRQKRRQSGAFGVFLQKKKKAAEPKRRRERETETALPLSRSPGGEGARAAEAALPAIGIEPFSVFLRALAAFLCGILFSRADTLFGAYPLGIALLCAAERYAPLVGLGVFAGGLSLGEGGTVYSFTAVFLLTVRLAASLFSDKRSFTFLPEGEGRRRVLFCEDVRLRTASACLGGFAVGVYQIIAGGYTYYDLFGSFLLVLGCPLGTWALSFLPARGEALTRRRLLSAAALCAAVLFSLSRLGPVGRTPALVAAMALTLLAGRERGVLPGTLAGLLSGLAAFPLHSPALAAAGLVCGALARLPLPLSAAASLVSAVFSVFLVGGASAFPAVLPELATGTAIALTLSRFRIPARFFGAAEGEPKERERARERAGEERMRALSRSFSSLSEMCYALSERAKKPNAGELRELFDSVCDRFCGRCPHAALCWSKKYDETKTALGRAAESMADGKCVTRGSFPPSFVSRCPSVDRIVGEINAGASALVRRRMNGDRSEIFAMDYESVASLIGEALEDVRREGEEEPALAEKTTRFLRTLFPGEGNARVTGRRKKTVTADGFAAGKTLPDAQTVRRGCEKLLGCSLSAPRYEIRGGELALTMKAVRRFRAEVFSLCRPKERERACGDTVAGFENREDFFYAMISDGMGSGEEAALISSVCSAFLRTMLTAGNAKNTSLCMLNDLIRTSDGECSATVDLFELDLLTGRASFVKSGAAPSFVRRDGRLYRIRSKTMPIGIMKAADAERVGFLAEDGDCVILQSDGVAQGGEECPWLFRLLSRSWDDDAGRMCARILDEAEKYGSGSDDRSVCIVRIRRTG